MNEKELHLHFTTTVIDEDYDAVNSLLELIKTTRKDINLKQFLNKKCFELSKTALHYAVGHDKADVVKLILEHGADPNLEDRDGNSPVDVAVSNGFISIVKTLIAHGAHKCKYGFETTSIINTSITRSKEKIEKWIKLKNELKGMNLGPLETYYSGYILNSFNAIYQLRIEEEKLKTLPKNSASIEINQISAEKKTEKEIPRSFLCPITDELMIHPVICTLDGRTYEEKAIKKWLEKDRTSPFNRKPIPKDQTIESVLVRNMSLEEMMEEFGKENSGSFNCK